MSTVKSSSANLTLNADGSGNDIKFQSNAVEKGSLTDGGVWIGSTFEPTGDTAASDNAAIGYTATEGLILTGQGSTNDVTIKNDADAIVLQVATGTTNVNVNGYLSAQEGNTHWHFVSPTVDMDSAAVIDFPTEITKGSAITESGGRMTCTIAGTYLLMAMFNNASDYDDTTNVWFRKNTTRIGGSLYWEGPTAGQDYSSQGCHVIITLAANDIVDVYGSGRWGGNTNNEAGTYFQGIRIGE
jgi:hypothetical protein